MWNAESQSYISNGVGKKCFICGEPCLDTGPDSPQVEHILPSTFAFFLFGLSSAQSQRSPIGNGGIHQVVSEWIITQLTADEQSAIDIMLNELSTFCSYNFEWAHARCNAIKDALVLINVVSIDNTCTKNRNSCDVLLTQPISFNEVSGIQFVTELDKKGKNAKNFVVGSMKLILALGHGLYQTRWHRYFGFNVAFAVLTASLVLGRPVPARAVDIVRAAQRGGNSLVNGTIIPEAYRLDRVCFQNLMDYWMIIALDSKDKTNIENIFMNKFPGDYTPIQYKYSPQPISQVIPFEQEAAMTYGGKPHKLLNRKMKKVRRLIDNKKTIRKNNGRIPSSGERRGKKSTRRKTSRNY